MDSKQYALEAERLAIELSCDIAKMIEAALTKHPTLGQNILEAMVQRVGAICVTNTIESAISLAETNRSRTKSLVMGMITCNLIHQEISDIEKHLEDDYGIKLSDETDEEIFGGEEG